MASPDDSQTWQADRYDDHHSFVSAYGSSVVELLDPRDDERILDLGCGTGHLANEIADAGATVVGLDSSAAMVDRARETYPDLEFVRADARSVAFDGAFDAAFSNAALHWIPAEEQEEVLASVRAALVPGGRFVAELGGTGNVGAIVEAVDAECAARGYPDAVDSPWYFPSVGEYAASLERRGFEVRYARLFDRPTELDGGAAGLRNWLAGFGDRVLAGVPETERAEVIAGVEDRLREAWFEDGTWTAPYRRLRFVAVADGD